MASNGSLLSSACALHNTPTTSRILSHPLNSDSNQHPIRRRSVNYDSNFNIKRSQVTYLDAKGSMLEYNDRVREVNRKKQCIDADVHSLQLTARTIPKSRFLPKLTAAPLSWSTKSAPSLPEGARQKSLNMPRSHTTIPQMKGAVLNASLKTVSCKEKLPMNFASASDLQEINNVEHIFPFSHQNSTKLNKNTNAWIQDTDSDTTLTIDVPRSSASSTDGCNGLITPKTTTVRFKLPVVNVAIPGNSDTHSLSLRETDAIIENDDDSTMGIADSGSATERDLARIKRENATKELLHSALKLLKTAELQKSRYVQPLPKIHRKRIKFPNQSLDSIPEDDAEELSDFTTRAGNRAELSGRNSFPMHSHLNKPMNFLDSPLESVSDRERCSDKNYAFDSRDHSHLPMINSTDKLPTLPPIWSKAETDINWRMLGGLDVVKNKRLQQHAKRKQKPRRIKFLKVDR